MGIGLCKALSFLAPRLSAIWHHAVVVVLLMWSWVHDDCMDLFALHHITLHRIALRVCVITGSRCGTPGEKILGDTKDLGNNVLGGGEVRHGLGR